MVFRPEHSKRDQNLQFTLLRESKSPNELLTRGGSSPSSYGSPSGPRTMAPVHDYVKRANVTPKFRVLFAPFNSESGVKILGTGLLLFGGYFNSSISGVIFTPKKEYFKLHLELK